MIYTRRLSKNEIEYFQEQATNCRGIFNEKKFQWLCEKASIMYDAENFQNKPLEKFEPLQREKKSLKQQQFDAMTYMLTLPREQRLLIMFQQDSEKYISCFSSDKFKSQAAREMIIGELKETFEFLKSKMVEFRWNKKFLLANGIDFIALRNLYFQLCVS